MTLPQEITYELEKLHAQHREDFRWLREVLLKRQEAFERFYLDVPLTRAHAATILSLGVGRVDQLARNGELFKRWPGTDACFAAEDLRAFQESRARRKRAASLERAAILEVPA